MLPTLAAPRMKVARRVFLTTRWQVLAMLNWEIDPAILRPLVPRGTELDFEHGRTYVSLVGFLYRDTRLLGLAIPRHVDFEEVNLRFYVRREVDGEVRRAVCFIKEIVPRWAVAATARWLYNERFVTLPMRHEITGPAVERVQGSGFRVQKVGDRRAVGSNRRAVSISPLSDATPTRRASEGSAEGRISYSWQTARRWNSLMLNYAGEPQPLVPGSHEEFIAEHYWGYCRQQGGGTLEYHVEHPPWKIWPATSAHLDCDAAALYGSTLAAVLCEPPTSAFLADGSPVAVMQPVRIA